MITFWREQNIDRQLRGADGQWRQETGASYLSREKKTAYLCIRSLKGSITADGVCREKPLCVCLCLKTSCFSLGDDSSPLRMLCPFAVELSLISLSADSQ